MSRTAFEQVCQERDQWRALVFENNDRWRAVVDRLLPAEPSPAVQSIVAALPPRIEEPRLPDVVSNFIARVSERNVVLSAELTTKAFRLVSEGLAPEDIPDALIDAMRVE